MTLGESIYYYRKRAGLSQEELAHQVGVSRQAVSRWELGEASPEAGKLLPLAEALGITTDQLLRGEAPEEAAPEAVSDGEGKKAAPSDWDRLPGFVARLVRRHGWLAGVYIALQGLGVAIVGGIARAAFKGMLGLAGSFMGGFGGMEVTATDALGNPVSLPPEVLERFMEQAGVTSGISGGGMVFGMERIFLGVVTVIMGLGILTMIVGGVLAVALYRKGRK